MKCARCGVEFACEASRVNRAARIGAPLYCNRACAGLARRLANPPTEAERKEAKRLHDEARRVRLFDRIKAEKRAYFQRTYDPVKAAIERKRLMPRHVAYCQRPEYREWKKQYDRQHSAKQRFGEFADAFLLLQDIEKEIDERATRYEIYMANGTINKAQTRRRYL